MRTAKLGFVFQSFNLLPRTTAVNNVLMPLDYSTSRRPASESLSRAHQLLERVGLQDRLDHVPSQMSGGQQQRVAIARSLVNQPALLLADEPTGNLDSHTSVEILRDVPAAQCRWADRDSGHARPEGRQLRPSHDSHESTE